ncbi:MULTISPECIES: hypothetical protein [Rhizobium]|uniref:Uncharacterized protein n=1 Tax=Rhizobium croatiense TaxID=2867516 RepID=A0ABS7LVG6_9HYPH|nr:MULTISPECIES: hypothetical protein [Rhizobium]MBY4628837.1 hypothetical protein [Rhizobium croatiense]WET74189.1 hypothetical protein PYR68_01270 [Rhizobium croatiense]
MNSIINASNFGVDIISGQSDDAAQTHPKYHSKGDVGASQRENAATALVEFRDPKRG